MMSENSSSSTQFLKRMSKVTLILGCAGFFVALYALAIHIQLLMQPGHSSVCDVNATISCSQVIGSSYGELASIPLGSFGMAYFAIIIAAAVTPRIAQVSKKWLATWELLIAIVGIASVFRLMYISYNILHLVCLTCTSIQTITIIYAILKIVSFIKSKNETYKAEEGAFSRFFAVALCLAIPPLMAGLVAPILVERFF